MNKNNREDFSYDLWGNPKLAEYDGNKVTFKMNPKYGKGISIFNDTETKIYPGLMEFMFNFKVDKSIYYFKKDSVFLGKVLEGKFILKEKEKQSIVFDKGDIFCVSVNFIIDENYSFENKMPVRIVGVFSYQEELVKTFQEKNWSTDSIVEIFKDSKLENGILINRSHEIEKIIADLNIAMVVDDRFTAFVKSADLFLSFINMMKKKEHTRAKSYTQQQIEEVIKIKKFLDDNLDRYYSMPELSEMFHISLSRMQSIFKDYYGISPYKYHLGKRLEKANYLIINTNLKIKSIAYSLGFSSYDKFFIAYKNKYGCNPSKDRIN